MDSLSVELNSGSLANDLSGEGHLVEPSVVDSGESTRTRSLLSERLALGATHGLGQDATLKLLYKEFDKH